MWYALKQGAKITERVISVKMKRSPLIQGGLEIVPMVVPSSGAMQEVW